MSTQLSDAISEAISRAASDTEGLSLAGIGPDDMAEHLCGDAEHCCLSALGCAIAAGYPPQMPFEALEQELRAGLAQLAAMRDHAHQWDFGDSESDPVRCVVCGADGLA
jgi:hypothetical protein